MGKEYAQGVEGETDRARRITRENLWLSPFHGGEKGEDVWISESWKKM